MQRINKIRKNKKTNKQINKKTKKRKNRLMNINYRE
jgi:hypothetical protein